MEAWLSGEIAQKGDLGLCNDWQRIMVLSIPSKLFCRIILERLKGALDKELRCNQAGFGERQIMHALMVSPMIFIMVVDWIIREKWKIRVRQVYSGH